MWLLHVLVLLLVMCTYNRTEQAQVSADEVCENCFRKEADQDTFCKSDFVIEVRVIRRILKKKNIKYLVKLLRTYKMHSTHPRPVKENKIISTNVDSACGVAHLLDNTVYILSGRISKRNMKINECYSIVLEKKKLTTVQRDNLDFRFIFNCDCSVKLFERCHPCKKTNDTCISGFNKFLCFNEFSACQRNSSTGKCEWLAIDTKSTEFDPECEIRSELPCS